MAGDFRPITRIASFIYNRLVTSLNQVPETPSFGERFNARFPRLRANGPMKPNMEKEIKEFLRLRPSGYDFPVGGNIEIPTNAEINLIESFQTCDLSEFRLDELRQTLSIKDAYSLMIFAVRTAIHSVRTDSPNTFQCCGFAICIDDWLVDWRDLLGVLAIVEDCSCRLGLDFQTELLRYSKDWAHEKAKDIFEGYFERSTQMRRVEVFGFKAVGENRSLMFV